MVLGLVKNCVKNMYFYAYAPLKFLEFLERTGAARSRNNQGNTQKKSDKQKENNQTSTPSIKSFKQERNKTKKPETRNLI